MKTRETQYSLLWSRKASTITLAVVAAGILGQGLVRSALAQHADAPAAPSKKLPSGHVLRIHGTVVSLEGDALTVGTMEGHQKAQKKLTLAPDVTITLASDKKHEPHGGQRSDLAPGTGVALTLNAEGTTVLAVEIMGRTVHGTIVAVDGTSMTITTKTPDGPKQEKLTLTPATVIVLSHGTNKGSVQTGTAADLKVNMPVSLSLSAVDKGTVREVAVQPVILHPKPVK